MDQKWLYGKVKKKWWNLIFWKKCLNLKDNFILWSIFTAHLNGKTERKTYSVNIWAQDVLSVNLGSDWDTIPKTTINQRLLLTQNKQHTFWIQSMFSNSITIFTVGKTLNVQSEIYSIMPCPEGQAGLRKEQQMNVLLKIGLPDTHGGLAIKSTGTFPSGSAKLSKPSW